MRFRLSSGTEVKTPRAITLRSIWPMPATGSRPRVQSRRRFAQGETMPVIASDYGATIWQWDDKQD